MAAFSSTIIFCLPQFIGLSEHFKKGISSVKDELNLKLVREHLNVKIKNIPRYSLEEAYLDLEHNPNGQFKNKRFK